MFSEMSHELDNNNCAPSFFFFFFFWGNCVKLEVIVWTEVFFWGNAAPKEIYRGPKQSPTNSHNDRNKDGAKLLLLLITAIETFWMHFRCNLWRKTLLNLRFTQCLSIPVREFQSVQTWRSSHNVINTCVHGVVRALVGILRENALCAHYIMYAGHYEKSLCSDNDPRCYSREMKIISSDWIALLCRLLIIDRVAMY